MGTVPRFPSPGFPGFHDGWGNVVQSWQEHGGAAVTSGESESVSVEYAYADGGEADATAEYVRVKHVEYPNGRRVHYRYPSSGVGGRLSRLDEIVPDDEGDPDTTAGHEYAAYTYLGAGTVVKVAHPAVDDGLNLTYGTGGTYGGFDRFGRIVDQKWQNDTPSVKDQFRYGYDRNSNRLYRENVEEDTLSELYHANGATLAAAYDGLDRLKEFRRGTLGETNRPNDSITADDDRRQFWTLDALGNWAEFKDDAGDGQTWDLDQDRAHNEVNEIDDIDGGAWEDPYYDAAGNTFYAGWPSGPSLWSFFDEEDWCFYKYDAWNRLVEVYTYVGGPPTTFGKYRYDGLHRRIWRIVDGFAPPNRTDYYYNTSWQVLEERFYDGEDPETTVATDVTCQYVWDPRYIDAPVCRDEDGNSDDDCTDTDWDTGDDPDEHLYYCQDANFNTTALVERSDGSAVERYVYDPYGKVTIYDDDWSDTVAWANSKKNAYLYCGYRYDHESRLYHVRHRSYHPTLGRWMQRDPMGYSDSANLYEYGGSCPVTSRDARGLQADHEAGADDSGECCCIDVTLRFEPGGSKPDWDVYESSTTVTVKKDGIWKQKDLQGWKVGFKVIPRFSIRGNYRLCHYFMRESGLLTSEWERKAGKGGEMPPERPVQEAMSSGYMIEADWLTRIEARLYEWKHGDHLGVMFPPKAPNRNLVVRLRGYSADYICVGTDDSSRQASFTAEGEATAGQRNDVAGYPKHIIKKRLSSSVR